MPIIMLIRNAYPYDFGGGERFPVHTAMLLQEKGYTPIVMSRSKAIKDYAASCKVRFLQSPWWSQQNWSGYRVVFVPVYILWQLLLCMWYIAVFLWYRPAAVHVQSKDDFIAATIAGRLTGRRVIWTDHADLKHIWLHIRTWYKNPVGKLAYLAAHLCHAITVVSESEFREVTAHIKKSSSVYRKITVVYNGCTDTPTHNKPAMPKGFIFCLAGRLVTDKGIGEAIAAFTRIQRHAPDAWLYIIGDGPEKDTFQQHASGNERIIFAGHKKNPLPYMAASDVFLQPTYHEGFSIVLVEASMLGLPIIATNVGGNKEIIFHEKTGLLIEAKHSQQLADAMMRLYKDAALRTKLATQARVQYEQSFVFDNIIARKFIPLYKGDAA